MSPAAPKVTDPLLQQFRRDFERISDGLDQRIPFQAPRPQHPGGRLGPCASSALTETRRSRKGDKPLRDLSSLPLIAQVVSRFDVVALQEVQGNIKALRHLLRVLGPSWTFLLTDENLSRDGQGERLTCLFDTRWAKPSGLACELVLPGRVRGQRGARRRPPGPVRPHPLRRQLPELGPDLHPRHAARARQASLGAHRRAARSRAGGAAGPTKRPTSTRTWSRPATSTSTVRATRTMRPSRARVCAPRPSTPDCPAPRPGCAAASSTTPGSPSGGRRKLKLGYEGGGGNFDFDCYVMRRTERVPLSHRISDHYPLWVESLVPRRSGS